MSEYPGAQPDENELRWNTGPGAETATEPNEGKKDAGWPQNAIPPYHEHNWWWGRAYLAVKHLLERAPREFTEVSEAVDADDGVGILDTFRIRQVVDNSAVRGAQVALASTTGQGTGNITAFATDGRYIYYSQGAGVYANDPATGAAVWSHTTNTATVNCLACDGYRVYVGRIAHGSEDEIEALDPVDGTVEASANPGVNIVDLAANGAKLLAANGSQVSVYTVAASSLTLDGNYSWGATVNAVAIDNNQGYCGGARSGGNDVAAFLLSSRANQWNCVLATGTPTVNDLTSDGEAVYAVTDSVATASGTASLFGIDRLLGSVAWELLGGFNHDQIHVDDLYLYAVRDTAATRLINKRDRSQITFLAAGTKAVHAIDPVSFVTYGTAGTDFQRYWTGFQTRICQRCNTTDIKRRPYYQKAIPIAG